MHRSAAAQEEDNVGVETDHCLKVWIIALGVAVVADRGLMHLIMLWHNVACTQFKCMSNVTENLEI